MLGALRQNGQSVILEQHQYRVPRLDDAGAKVRRFQTSLGLSVRDGVAATAGGRAARYSILPVTRSVGRRNHGEDGSDEIR